MSAPRYSQFCALARAAEVLGERWTLLIIRELLLGPKRFSDLEDRLAGISPTLLTSRLNALVENRVVQRAISGGALSGQAYELTPVGRDLQPTIRELIRWGGHFLFPVRTDDEFEPDWVLLGLDAITRLTPTPACRIGLIVVHKAKSAGFVVVGGPAGTRIERAEPAGSAVVTGRFDVLLRIIGGRLPVEEAASAGQAMISGSMRVARQLPTLFDLVDRIH